MCGFLVHVPIGMGACLAGGMTTRRRSGTRNRAEKEPPDSDEDFEDEELEEDPDEEAEEPDEEADDEDEEEAEPAAFPL